MSSMSFSNRRLHIEKSMKENYRFAINCNYHAELTALKLPGCDFLTDKPQGLVAASSGRRVTALISLKTLSI